MGVRPEHVQVSRIAGAIEGQVSHVEKLGGETLACVKSALHGLLTLRLFGEHDFIMGETLYLSPEPQRQFHFDAEGLRLRIV